MVYERKISLPYHTQLSLMNWRPIMEIVFRLVRDIFVKKSERSLTSLMQVVISPSLKERVMNRLNISQPILSSTHLHKHTCIQRWFTNQSIFLLKIHVIGRQSLNQSIQLFVQLVKRGNLCFLNHFSKCLQRKWKRQIKSWMKRNTQMAATGTAMFLSFNLLLKISTTMNRNDHHKKVASSNTFFWFRFHCSQQSFCILYRLSSQSNTDLNT